MILLDIDGSGYLIAARNGSAFIIALTPETV